MIAGFNDGKDKNIFEESKKFPLFFIFLTGSGLFYNLNY